eukprot:11062587-Lingulodinium_polyedra.AAC.1
MALFVLLTFSAYLRPGECRAVSTLDLVRPSAVAARDMQRWVLVLAPWERGRPTKPGRFDET